LVLAAVLALLPLSAQAQVSTSDATAQLAPVVALQEEFAQSGFTRDWVAVQNAVARCQTPDPDTVWDAEVLANQYAQRAAELANTTPGLGHAAALRLEQQLELDYYQLANPVTPDVCYQPPS
jgi:hypothetical protein